MIKKIKIKCPLTGKKYNILSKKGQEILKNYKRYKNMKGGVRTLNTNVPINPQPVQLKPVFTDKTSQNITITSGQQDILKMLQLQKNPIQLINSLIIMNIASSLLSSSVLDYIKEPNDLRINQIKINFNKEKKNIIKMFKLDGFSEYIMYRLFSFEHFLLSIIEELQLYKIPNINNYKQQLISKVSYDLNLFTLEIILNNKARKDEEEAKKNIQKIKKNNPDCDIILHESSDKYIKEVRNYYMSKNLYKIYKGNSIEKLQYLYFYMMYLFKKNNYTKLNNEEKKYVDMYASLLKNSPFIHDLVELETKLKESGNYQQDIFFMFFLTIEKNIQEKLKKISLYSGTEEIPKWKYELELNLFQLIIIDDNYMRLGSVDKQLLLHDKCMRELHFIIDIDRLIQNMSDKNILKERINTEFKTKQDLTLLSSYNENELNNLKKLHDKLQENIKYVTLYNSITLNTTENSKIPLISSSSVDENDIYKIEKILKTFIEKSTPISTQIPTGKISSETTPTPPINRNDSKINIDEISNVDPDNSNCSKFQKQQKSFEVDIDVLKQFGCPAISVDVDDEGEEIPNSNNLTQCEIKGDNHCFYNSVLASYYLHTGKIKYNSAQELRYAVAEKIQEYWSKLNDMTEKQNFLAQFNKNNVTEENIEEEFNKIIEGIKGDEWGDQPLYPFIVDIFETGIDVYDSNITKINGTSTNIGQSDKKYESNNIKISYNMKSDPSATGGKSGGNHYNALGPNVQDT